MSRAERFMVSIASHAMALVGAVVDEATDRVAANVARKMAPLWRQQVAENAKHLDQLGLRVAHAITEARDGDEWREQTEFRKRWGEEERRERMVFDLYLKNVEKGQSYDLARNGAINDVDCLIIALKEDGE
jgi:hypothetical protein